MYIKKILIILLTIMSYTTTQMPDGIKPFGLRRKYERGLGDRYYQGLPAYAYEHFWPEWKRETWYTIGDWDNEEAPEWIRYYNYPYVIWPNFYRYFGSPYYTRSLKEREARSHPDKAVDRRNPAIKAYENEIF